MLLKVIIQIPCFNEERTLGIALNDLPKSLPGIDEIEWLVIDDGSSDKTAEVAARYGAHHVVKLSQHQGLSAAFMTGIRACIDRGADIIVNTDADNQYCAKDLTKLIEPILSGRAEFVLGARPLNSIPEFSRTKKLLHAIGGWVMTFVTRQRIPDPTTGFRAMTRGVASRMEVVNRYTYTLETLIHLSAQSVVIHSVDVRTNPALRPSRLINSMSGYLWQSIRTICLTSIRYFGNPRRVSAQTRLELAESLG